MRQELLNHKTPLTFRTQCALICSRLMGVPCWCLLSMLVFILYKNLQLTPWQITIIIALKPASSLLSPYWSQAIYQRPDRIITNLIGANLLRHLPFLFIPWIESPWFIIFSFGLYMMLTRATIPAWMELLKYSLPEKKREETIGYGATVDYLGTAIFAVGMGMLLDYDQESWRWLFLIAAGLGILSFLPLIAIPTKYLSASITSKVLQDSSIKEKIAKPWQQVWQLILGRKDFTLFQIGFMFGGGGLMIMQPALPQLFIDIFHLSFTEMGVAISLCKGIGVALTTPLWARLFRKLNIFQLSALVTFFASLFPFLLLATSFHSVLLYFAYAFYGVMQAGSEMSWHMSGLVFAREKDSTTFSITNVLTIGIRGCIVPALGFILLPYIDSLGVILLGAFLCLFASSFFLFYGRTDAFSEKVIP